MPQIWRVFGLSASWGGCRACHLVTIGVDQLRGAGCNVMTAWKMVALGVLSALVWMLGLYWEPSMLWILLPVAMYAWLYGRMFDLTLGGWLWRTFLLSVANLVTQCVVLFGFGLDEVYVRRLVADAPPDATGFIALLALFFSLFAGSGAPAFGAVIGYAIVGVRRRRRVEQ